MTNNQHGQVPEALRLAALFDADEWPGNVTLVSYARECVAELRRLHALTAQAISQPGGFDAGDMASAAAQGYRDGWTAAQADSVLEDAARLTSEQEYAIRQGHEIAASDGYFDARPQIESKDRRKVFQAGFERGWDAARKQGANHD